MIKDLIELLEHHQPIHAIEIAQKLDLPQGGNQVETRNLIRDAISQGHIIISNTRTGYKIAESQEEFDEHIESLKGRISGLENRIKSLIEAWQQQP